MLPRLSVAPIYRCRSVFLSKNKGLFIRNFVTTKELTKNMLWWSISPKDLVKNSYIQFFKFRMSGELYTLTSLFDREAYRCWLYNQIYDRFLNSEEPLPQESPKEQIYVLVDTTGRLKQEVCTLTPELLQFLDAFQTNPHLVSPGDEAVLGFKKSAPSCVYVTTKQVVLKTTPDWLENVSLDVFSFSDEEAALVELNKSLQDSSLDY